MIGRRGWIAAAAAATLAFAPSAARLEAVDRCQPSGVGTDSFCKANGVRLHFVDWGGEGPPLLLLAGFGATARTFDDLAPRLASRRHVYAVTRRGFGQSEQTPGAYAAERFTEDLIGLMDRLGIARADLVGHSAAGAEMARLARAYPQRVRRLVYLDAAYDFSGALQLQGADPVDRTPPPRALNDWPGFIAFRQDLLGTRSVAVEADARETVRLDHGRLEPVTAPDQALAIAGALLTGAPDYAAVAAPSLAIYAPKIEPEQTPPETSDEVRAAAYRYALRRVRPWMLRAQATFLERAPCGVAFERVQATHHFYLTDSEWSARTILSFLDSAAPCAWKPPAEGFPLRHPHPAGIGGDKSGRR